MNCTLNQYLYDQSIIIFFLYDNLNLFTFYTFFLSDLERAACAFAVLCLVSMGAGLITGACGLFGHHTKILVWASCCSLVSGTETFKHSSFPLGKTLRACSHELTFRSYIIHIVRPQYTLRRFEFPRITQLRIRFAFGQ